jgi:hypothetical protein
LFYLENLLTKESFDKFIPHVCPPPIIFSNETKS